MRPAGWYRLPAPAPGGARPGASQVSPLEADEGGVPVACPHPSRRTRIVKRVITAFVVIDAVVLGAVMAWVVR